MTPEKIKKTIDRHFKRNIASRKRTKEYLFYRDLYFDLAFMYCYPKFSYASIGKEVNRDHATVLHFVKKKVRYENHNEKIEHFTSLFGDPSRFKNIDSQTMQIMYLKEELEIFKTGEVGLENEQLREENEALKERLENLKKQKSDFINRLNDFPIDVQETIRWRFSLILDAESKKIYSYKEKRKNELKMAK